MSQGKNEDQEDLSSSQAYQNRSAEMLAMIYQGRPFSGHERHCCFLNTLPYAAEGDRFATISAISGLDVDDDGRALCSVDWDHDGDLDLWISNRNAPRLRFFRNDLSPQHASIQFQLVGNGQDTNRAAVGARVTVTYHPGPAANPDAGAQQVTKTLRAGEGFLSQSAAWLHFGLGPSPQILSVRVAWPNADHSTETFTAADAPGRYRLVQGSGRAEPVPPRSDRLALQPSSLEVPPDDQRHRIPLIHPLQVPEFGYLTFEGKPQPLTPQTDQVTLINLWSATCKPCLQELSEFTRRQAELKAAGVRVVAISVDALQSNDPRAAATARQTAERLQLPFEVGLAPPAVIEDLRLLHDALITLDRPLPMPSSFLIDRQGRLDVIYKGPIEVETLLRDAAERDLDPLARVRRAASFDGSTVGDPIVDGAVIRNQAMVHYKRAKQLLDQRMYDDASREYESVLRYWPESATIVNDLGVLRMLQGRHDEAMQQLRRASELDPRDPVIPCNLARAMEKQGRFDDAAAVLNRTVDQFPADPNAHFMLGVLHLRKNNVAAAKASFEAALQRNPRHDRALYSLGNLLLSLGDATAAKKHLLLAVRLVPNEAVVLSAAGRALLLEEDWTEAEKLLRRAVQQQPQFPEAQFHLGRALAAQKRWPEAAACFEATLKLDNQYPGAWEALQQAQRGGTNAP